MSPLHQLLGIRLVEEHDDGVTMELPVRPELFNDDGFLHGGATAALADAAVGVALKKMLRPGERRTTVELKLNYLRPTSAGVLRARSRFLRRGRTLAVAEVRIVDSEGELAAAALATYMVLRNTEGPPKSGR